MTQVTQITQLEDHSDHPDDSAGGCIQIIQMLKRSCARLFVRSFERSFDFSFVRLFVRSFAHSVACLFFRLSIFLFLSYFGIGYRCEHSSA